MGRPRKWDREHWPPGLYKNGQGVFWHRDRKTGQTTMLGRDENVAVRAANLLQGRPDLTPPRKTLNEELMDEASIVAQAKPYSAVVGVYFLILGGAIMYVGQSTDVAGRIADHWKDPKKVFDSVHVIECHPEELATLEIKYIRHFKPQFNVVGTSYRSA